jgi:hypothetical protein
MKITDLTKTLPTLISNGDFKEVFSIGAHRLYSNRTDLLLRRDLSVPLPKRPQAKIPLTLRELCPNDIQRVAKWVPSRLPALKAGLRTCYVAVTEDDDICYMQWLIDPSQNHLRPINVGLVLKSDERLLEWAFTFEKYRGLGIMACAMAQIAERGLETGARWALTLVEKNNIASLKGCRSAGFRPHQVREERWRSLHLTQRYTPLPTDTLYSFETAATT